WLTALCLALFLATSGRVNADLVKHVLDDGTAEFTTGFSVVGGSVVFANHFTTVPGGELINTISVAYRLRGSSGAALPGTPLQVILFQDKNHGPTPSQPVLLASAPTTVMSPGTDTFIPVAIPPTFVEGDFFAGVLVSNLPPGGLFPISFDRTTPQKESFGAWFSFPIDLDRIGIMTFDPTVTTDQSLRVNSNAFLRAIDGNYLIRAEGIAAPEPSALGGFAVGAVALLGYAWRRRRAA